MLQFRATKIGIDESDISRSSLIPKIDSLSIGSICFTI